MADYILALSAVELPTWVTWGLQGLVGFVLGKLWSKVEEALKAVNDLKVELAKNYATTEEVTLVRSRVHDLTAWVMQEKAIRELLREQAKEKGSGDHKLI